MNGKEVAVRGKIKSFGQVSMGSLVATTEAGHTGREISGIDDKLAVFVMTDRMSSATKHKLGRIGVSTSVHEDVPSRTGTFARNQNFTLRLHQKERSRININSNTKPTATAATGSGLIDHVRVAGLVGRGGRGISIQTFIHIGRKQLCIFRSKFSSGKHQVNAVIAASAT